MPERRNHASGRWARIFEPAYHELRAGWALRGVNDPDAGLVCLIVRQGSAAASAKDDSQART